MCFSCNDELPPMFDIALPENGISDSWEPVGVQKKVRSSARLVPRPWCIMKNIRSISACIHQNAAIDSNNDLWTWGAKAMAQLEDGSFTNDAPQNIQRVPQKIMNHALMVSCGGWHTMCVTEDCTLWAWGENEFGQLGLGDFDKRSQPVCVMEEVKLACAGEYQSFVIKKDHTLWGWGLNDSGTLLDADRYCHTPKLLLDSVVHVSCGSHIIVAVRQDGTLWAWGHNIYGTIFTEPMYRRCKPVCLMKNIAEASCFPSDNNVFGLAIAKNSDLYCFGGEKFGSKINMSIRKQGEKNPIKLAQNISHAYAGNDVVFLQDKWNRLFAFGRNELGQCGTGKSTAGIKIPTLIMTHAQQVASGYFHAMCLQTNGNLWIWGGDYGINIAQR